MFLGARPPRGVGGRSRAQREDGGCCSTAPSRSPAATNERHRGPPSFRSLRARRQVLGQFAAGDRGCQAGSVPVLRRPGDLGRPGDAPWSRPTSTAVVGAGRDPHWRGAWRGGASPLSLPPLHGSADGRPDGLAVKAPVHGAGDRSGAMAVGSRTLDRPSNSRTGEPLATRWRMPPGAVDNAATVGGCGSRQPTVVLRPWGHELDASAVCRASRAYPGRSG